MLCDRSIILNRTWATTFSVLSLILQHRMMQKSCTYMRPKAANSVNPDGVPKTMKLTIACDCFGSRCFHYGNSGDKHQPLLIKFNNKGEVTLRETRIACTSSHVDSCLHNLFLFNIKGMTPEKHILRNWVKRSKTFGTQNVGKEHLSGATAQTS